jgi:hypothetical protein
MENKMQGRLTVFKVRRMAVSDHRRCGRGLHRLQRRM